MKSVEDSLGIGSDVVLAALATVKRKPMAKRKPKKPSVRTNAGEMAVLSSATSLSIVFPVATTHSTVQNQVILDTSGKAVAPAVPKPMKISTASTRTIPAADPMALPSANRISMLENCNEAVLTTLTTVALKPISKPRKSSMTTNSNAITAPVPAVVTSVKPCPLVAGPPLREICSVADRTTLDILVPFPKKSCVTANKQSLPVLPISAANSPVEDPPMLDIGSNSFLGACTTIKPKSKQFPAATISPNAKTIPSNLVDLTESISPKPNSISGAKRQEMAEYRRNNKDCTLKDMDKVVECSARQGEGLMNRTNSLKAKLPVPKAVVEIAKVPNTHFTSPEAADTAGTPSVAFTHNREEVKRQTKAAVVDYWFNGDARGERELTKYVKEAVKTIKIGMDLLNDEETITELGAAVGRGVAVQLFIDFKIGCDENIGWVKELLEAGVKVCHSTEKFEWKAAIFDGQILVQGSLSWSTKDLHELDVRYTMVHAGPIASAFECQFDKMWTAATKKVKKGGKRVRTGAGKAQREGVETSDSEESSSEMEPGKKRKQGKRTFFPTTLAFLEMLGF